MESGFECPTCRVPLRLRCVAMPAGDVATSALCPNPFCRTELPSRREEMSLSYELYGVLSPAAEAASE